MATATEPLRILYIYATLVPPSPDLRMDRFTTLSDTLEGDILHPLWWTKPEQVEAVFGPGSYPVHTLGRFRYHWFLASSDGLRQKIDIFRFYIRKGLELYRQRPFDCIVAYSHMTTGLIAGVLKLLTGAKLIIEVVISPQLAYISDRPKLRLRDRAMKVYSDISLHLTMLLNDHAHLLFPGQLSLYPLLRRVPHSVFHDFVPVSVIKRSQAENIANPYILLVGMPWYRKGADILIKAFRLIAADFPQVWLKLLGHYPDQMELRALADGCPRIEFMKARPNPEALPIIAGAAVMAVPSRNEGLARVIIEGMAAGLAIVSSDVAGASSILHDGESGILVPGDDPPALAAALRKLLEDPDLRRRLGDSAYAFAHTQLSETSYAEHFLRMVRTAVQGHN